LCSRSASTNTSAAVWHNRVTCRERERGQKYPETRQPELVGGAHIFPGPAGSSGRLQLLLRRRSGQLKRLSPRWLFRLRLVRGCRLFLLLRLLSEIFLLSKRLGLTLLRGPLVLIPGLLPVDLAHLVKLSLVRRLRGGRDGE